MTKVAQSVFVYICPLPDGNSDHRTMQVPFPVVPGSPSPLASHSEKELGYCVLAGIPSSALPAPERIPEMAKDTALHQLCDSTASPHLLQVPM